jgi:hypothetical protein
MSHVPTRHYSALMSLITKDKNCFSTQKAYWEVETTYCPCTEQGYSDGFPAIEMNMGDTVFLFEAKHYLMWDRR